MDAPEPHPLRADFWGSIVFDLHRPTGRGLRQITLRADTLDEQARELFGAHQCHRLAAALACLMDWDQVFVVDRRWDGTWAATHSAARMPDGAAVDVFGRTTPAALARRWQAAHPRARVAIRTMTVAEMPGRVLVDVAHQRGDRWWWARECPPELVAATVHVARLVLAEAGLRPPF